MSALLRSCKGYLDVAKNLNWVTYTDSIKTSKMSGQIKQHNCLLENENNILCN